MDTSPPFQRARTPEARARRSADLLEAAFTLAARGTVQSVTLPDIAEAAGVHRSAVRRYFDSREDVLLHLAGQGWKDWSEAVAANVADRDALSVQEVARLLSASLAERPVFCDLLAHVTATFERSVPPESVRQYKLAAAEALRSLSGTLKTAIPALTDDDCRDVVATVTAVAANFWQTANPPPALDALYQRDPQLAHARVAFEPRLAHVLDRLLAGILAAHTPARS
jgi:AcrR family transcriptional regulator